MGRLTGAVAALALALTLSGCTGAPDDAGAAATISARPGSGAGTTALPAGIYGLESAALEGTADALTIDAPGDCQGLLATLEAGQWSVNAFVTPSGALDFYLVELHRDGRSGLLRMSGSDTICHGVLSVSHEEAMSLSGDAVAEGTAQFLPYDCQYQDEEKTLIALTALYDLEDDLHVSVTAAFDVETGELDPESIEVATLRGPEPLIATMGRMLALSFAGEEDDDSEPTDSAGYYPDGEVDGEVTISSASPLTGTIAMSGLLNEETGAELSLTASFRCTP